MFSEISYLAIVPSGLGSVGASTGRRTNGSLRGPGKERKLDQGATRLLEEDLNWRPEASYLQRAKLLFELLGVQVSEATLCRAVKRLGYTRKKDQWVRASGTSG